MTTPAPTLRCQVLGLVPYREALRLQEEYVRARAEGAIGDTLLLVEHPPVLTAGRGTGDGSLRVGAEALATHGLEVVPVARGGDVTWHGPGQLVGYPVCDLAARDLDLHGFLRGLEQALMVSVKRWGVDAHRTPGRTGVWVGERKLASIGIAVRRWISYHGFALNVRPDLTHFELIHPCGLKGVHMTSLAALLGPVCPSWSEITTAVAADLSAALGYSAASVTHEQVEAATWSDVALRSSAAARRDARGALATTQVRPGGMAA